ncbi:MAG: alanine--tRNA ligase [Dehalococcoidales bacterium]
MNSDELRSAFLKFFEEKGHKVIPSSSLIPKDNPTLLLTTAGMVQIQPFFLGQAKPPANRLASCQKCFRTTDIESVGDASHLTFFEMLGNFSVGDYFKKEAIAWAWEFVTERLKLPKEKLWITIYLDDEVSFKIWRDIGIPADRIVRCDEKDNYWGPPGSSGPCGPCSEIHYDLGKEKSCGPNCKPNDGCSRFVEIWNLVFTQYFQDEAGKRTPLPKPNIDTGMGLERTLVAVNDKQTIYETDPYTPLVSKVSELSGKNYGANPDDDNAMRIVAEHGRALAFLIADGVLPDNEGRGYVLRRLLRRAQYFSETLIHEKHLLYELAKLSISNMKHIYPELEHNKTHILKLIESEVEKFQKTLHFGRGVLQGTFLKLREELRDYFPRFEESFRVALSKSDFLDLRDGANNSIDHFQRDSGAWEHLFYISGKDVVTESLEPVTTILDSIRQEISNYSVNERNPLNNLKRKLQVKFKQLQKTVNSVASLVTGYEAFILHDTYGFPIELTKEIVAKSGFSVDMEGFEKEMGKQRERARASQTFKDVGTRFALAVAEPTSFVGYNCFEHEAKIVKLLVDPNYKEIKEAKAGQSVGIVLDATPFYGEMGGQVGDTGEIIAKTGKFHVADTVHLPGEVTLHDGKIITGSLVVGDEVKAVVDIERRRDIARNHTATHLLQAALRQVLGDHIQQRGSLVAPEHLRFDFSHLAAMTRDEIKEVQRIVNDRIRQNLKVYYEETDYKKAVAAGAIALFDEKYGDVVRVMRIGEPVVSAELCGGTHASSTGEIGYFHILSESSIGAGIRRIEAVTGRGAEAFIDRRLSGLEEIAQSLETSPEDAKEKLSTLLAELETTKKHALSLERELAKNEAETLLDKVEVIKGIKVLAARVSSDSQAVLREMADFLRDKLQSGIVVLGAVSADRPVFIATVTPDLVAKGYNAGDIVKKVSQVAGGGGGGKANFAQAGGKDKNKLDEALHLVKSLI